MLEAADPRGRMFGASAFLPRQLVKDLRAGGVVTVKELYTMFAEIELGSNNNIQCRSAAGLCYHQRSSLSRYSSSPRGVLLELPSWVPDWTCRKINEPLWIVNVERTGHDGQPLYEAASDVSPKITVTTSHAGNLHVASVRGLVLGDVSACSQPFHIHVIPEGTDAAKHPERVLHMMSDYMAQFETYMSIGLAHLQGLQSLSASDQLTAVRQTLIGSATPVAMGAVPGANASDAQLTRSQPEQTNLLFEDFEKDVKLVKKPQG